ncbi:hypothetical protein FISHEDRAFT_78221 [Fistulina hepatica ATCC 64428]|nr:hypothetical protein FISHEDRAFT_78221 [Fistulina hepatica ATCC 64428]
MFMKEWEFCSKRSTPCNHVYTRLLGHLERGFYYGRQMGGSTDVLQHSVVDRTNPNDQSVFSRQNITQAWLHLKAKFPLLAAQGEQLEDGIRVRFIVSEARVNTIVPGEISFLSLSLDEEVEELIEELVNKRTPEKQLSSQLLARLFIVHRTDKPDRLHMIALMAHCITDGMGNTAIARNFLQVLSKQGALPKEQWEQRIHLAGSSEALLPARSAARERWNRALGNVLWNLRVGRMRASPSFIGGQTLPRRFTTLTPSTPALSRLRVLYFDPAFSRSIMQCCHAQGITFGNALPILGQVALGRVLCRCFLRGDISKAEWEFRKREPTLSGGPANLRTYLDHAWQHAGGLTSVSCTIGFFFYQLPFIPLGRVGEPGVNEVPSFADLLSPGRFLHRARVLKAQADTTLRHPRFVDMNFSRLPDRSLAWQRTVEEYLAREASGPAPSPQEVSVIDQARNGFMMAHGGSTLGNMDHFIPMEYPLEDVDLTSRKCCAATEPRLRVISSGAVLRASPAELYLGASTKYGQLNLFVVYDEHVYDKALVLEWLGEVVSATTFYFGEASSHKQGGGIPRSHL